MYRRVLRALFLAVCGIGGLFLGLSFTFDAAAQSPDDWEVHDPNRPQPPIVAPGMAATADQPGQSPSDAIVLFDGNDLSHWQSRNGGPAQWKVEDGYMEVVKGTGPISTRLEFGDIQMHVEWVVPCPPSGEGQGRGNSGIFLMGQYEVQVLDSYQNKTYPDGQASAIYGQYPPLVNASRPPCQWQTYDIIFTRPRFDSNEALVSPSRVTVLHNGVLVQNNIEVTGPTGHHERPPYKVHPERLPLSLQDHGDPVRYRNVWVRDLEKN